MPKRSVGASPAGGPHGVAGPGSGGGPAGRPAGLGSDSDGDDDMPLSLRKVKKGLAARALEDSSSGDDDDDTPLRQLAFKRARPSPAIAQPTVARAQRNTASPVRPPVGSAVGSPGLSTGVVRKIGLGLRELSKPRRRGCSLAAPGALSRWVQSDRAETPPPPPQAEEAQQSAPFSPGEKADGESRCIIQA